MSLGRIGAIALNTVREAIRNRAFLGLILLALAFLLFSLALTELAVPGEAMRIVIDFGYFATGLFGALIAIVIGVILVYKEVDKKTIYTIIPKPVHRFEFILGKFAGMLAILFVGMAVMVAVWFFVLYSQGEPPTGEIAKGLVLIFSEVALVAALAIFFSSFSSPILSGVLTVGIFITGRTIYMVSEMLAAHKSVFTRVPALRPIGEFLVAVVPDLQTFNATQDILLGIPISPEYVLAAMSYAAAYVLVFLLAAMLVFQRRDFV